MTRAPWWTTGAGARHGGLLPVTVLVRGRYPEVYRPATAALARRPFPHPGTDRTSSNRCVSSEGSYSPSCCSPTATCLLSRPSCLTEDWPPRLATLPGPGWPPPRSGRPQYPLGTLGLTGWARGFSVVLVSCQVTATPIGLVLGAELAQAIGEPAGYVGAGVFIALGTYLLLERDTSEAELVRKRISEKVLGLIGLGVSISPDELAAGFGLGLAHIPVAAGFVAIAPQGLIAS